MDFELDFTQGEDYLFVSVAGERTADNVLKITMAIMSECEQTGLDRVLVDVRALAGALLTMNAYELPADEYPRIRDSNILKKAAILDREDAIERGKFFETVARNRGFNIGVFTDMESAREWLLA
jgi:hypothetical protein